MIDRQYRTVADRKHRAIVGFSMGGGQAARFGLGHLETFSQIGIMSAGMAGGVDTEPLATLKANPAKANQQIDLLWIACGKEDAAMKGAQTLHHALEQVGIEHTFLETDGAHHWRVSAPVSSRPGSVAVQVRSPDRRTITHRSLSRGVPSPCRQTTPHQDRWAGLPARCLRADD